MFDIGWTELFIVVIVAVIVVGPKDLPKMMRVVGRWTGRARAMADQFRRSFDDMARQAELEEMRAEVMKVQNEKTLTDMQRETDEMLGYIPLKPDSPPPAPGPKPVSAPAKTPAKTPEAGAKAELGPKPESTAATAPPDASAAATDDSVPPGDAAATDSAAPPGDSAATDSAAPPGDSVPQPQSPPRGES